VIEVGGMNLLELMTGGSKMEETVGTSVLRRVVDFPYHGTRFGLDLGRQGVGDVRSIVCLMLWLFEKQEKEKEGWERGRPSRYR